MNLTNANLEEILLEYVDKIKELLSPRIWETILLDSSKNEILLLFFLYRYHEANMTQLAEYMNVPLNTATGIVSRMEQKGMIQRERSREDKRVVTIALEAYGREQISSVLKQFLFYGQRILAELSSEELALIENILNKVLKILQQEQKEESVPNKIRKIEIC